MFDFEINPFRGVGPLLFGMSRVDARGQLGHDYTTFRKTPDSPNTTDAFGTLGIHLYFDEDDHLDFVEFIVSRSQSIRYAGISLADNSIDELIKRLQGLGHSAVREPDGCYFVTLGIAVYSEGGERIQSIGVYGKFRFDSFLKLSSEIAERRRLRAERRKNAGRLQ